MILSLYSKSDFEEEFRNYQAWKDKADPEVNVHYFRVARMMRDILFTCSAIDFGYEMTRQSRALDPTFPGVRLYNLNQTVLAPLLKAAGKGYMGVCHGSDIPYVYNGLFLEGPMLEADLQLAVSVASSFINFAYTGVPANTDDPSHEPWPEAFSGLEALKEPRKLGFTSMNLQLIGGPFGTGASQLTDRGASMSEWVSWEDTRTMQALMVSNQECERADCRRLRERKRQLERQKLFERCKFINSLSEKLDI